MMMKTIVGALALTFSTAAFAAEPAPSEPKKECCCCKKDAEGKMACCDKHDKAKPAAQHHDGHGQNGMSGH